MMSITVDRVIWAHRCHVNRDLCEEPGAHFKGSDAEWAVFVRLCREDSLAADAWVENYRDGLT